MRRILIPALALAVLTVASCSKLTKDASTVIPTNILSNANIKTLLSTMATPSKTTTLNATTGGSFIGNNGARYIFPANGFCTASGASVTGTVTIQTAEYLKKSDMIFSGVLPISNGNSIISGGETYVRAMQGSQEVFMKRGSMYQVNLPQQGTPLTGMQLFFSGGAFRTTASGVNWQLNADSSRGTIVYDGDSISIVTDSMHFANADQFLSSPNYQSFTITLNAGGLHIGDTVLAYALFDNYNALWQMTGVSSGVISEGHVPNIPVHFVVATIINNQLYAGILAATPATGTNYNITLTEMSPVDLKSAIDAL